MDRLGIVRLALVGVIGLVAACAAPPADEVDHVKQALIQCSSNCNCPLGYHCDNGWCSDVDFSPKPDCYASCQCSSGQACAGGHCTAIGSPCTWIGGPYQGCSQYENVWCSWPGQSVWWKYPVGPNAALCGGNNYEWVVYCNEPGTIQSDGSCR